VLEYPKRYWQWALARTTWWGKGLAIGGPVLGALIAVAAIVGGSDENSRDAKASPTAPRAAATVAGPTSQSLSSAVAPTLVSTRTSAPPASTPPPPPTDTPLPVPTSTPQPPPPPPTDTPLPVPTSTSQPPPPPPSPPPPAATGVTIVSITSPRSPGQTATLSARAAPGASCSISYVTPAGTNSTAQGLIAKQADGAGNVSWSWVIGSNTRAGTGTVRVTCNGQTATTQIVIS
jgi:outer membrane biosynthesis protein TonB